MDRRTPHGRIETSAERRILKALLHKRLIDEKGDLVTYTELTGAIGGRNVQKEAGGLLRGARKDLNVEYKVLTDVVTNVGVKLADDIEAFVSREKKRCGRLARRASRSAVNAIDGADLSKNTAAEIMVELACLNAIEHFTRPVARKMIAGHVDAASPKELPPLEAIKAQFNSKP